MDVPSRTVIWKLPAQNELMDKQQGTSVRFILIHTGPIVEKKTNI